MATGVFNYIDFRGGYATDVPHQQLASNELLSAKNLYWDKGARKREGYYDVASIGGALILGAERYSFNGAQQWVVAVQPTGANVEMRIGTAGAVLATIEGVVSVSCTTFDASSGFKFTNLGEQIIGTNGTDKPVVIYKETSTVVLDTLEHYDERERHTDDWVAGFYGTASALADDTDDAQSDISTDTILCGTSSNTGFYVGCDFTFNRVNFIDCEEQDTATMAYEYYGRATSNGDLAWCSMSTEEIPTWSAVGDHALQWAFPMGSEGDVLMEQIVTDTSSLDLKYAIRGYLTGDVITSITCAKLEVRHNQYLSQLFLGDTPDTCTTHKNHVFLGAGNWARISPANSLKGWRYADYEYFYKGGTIKTFVSHTDRLLVLLDSHMYGIAGNSWANWVLQDIGPYGCSGEDAINHEGEIYYPGTKYIMKFDGQVPVPISKHIKTDVDSWGISNAIFMSYKGMIWIGFPGSDTMLVFDPDTFRTDDVGDGRVGFYEFDNVPISYWVHSTNAPYFLYDSAGSGARIFIFDEQYNYDDNGSTATVPIDYEIEIPMNIPGFLEDKQLRRMKVRMENVDIATATASGLLTMYVLFKNVSGYGSATFSTTFDLLTTGGITEANLGCGHEIDGRQQSMKIQASTVGPLCLLGCAVEARRRGF